MYKIGDKVKVRSDLQIGHFYGIYAFSYSMSKHFGKWARIIDVKPFSYSIDIDKGKWAWSKEMFESNPSNKLFKLL